VLTCLPSNYVPLVNLIGIYFQRREDLMNLQSPCCVISRLTMVENV
jgi:hypothetical protein